MTLEMNEWKDSKVARTRGESFLFSLFSIAIIIESALRNSFATFLGALLANDQDQITRAPHFTDLLILDYNSN